MLSEILKNINWVDVLVICITIRIVYIGGKRGFVVEFFKCIAVLLTIFITFHYYPAIAKLLESHLSIFQSTSETLCFALLWLLVSLIFKLVREGIMLMIKMEAHALLDKWGGFFIGLLRSVLIGSVFLVFLQITGLEYINKNVRKSFSNSYLFDVSPNVYKACYDGLVDKFFPSEKLNLSVFKLKTLDLKDSPKN